MVRALASHQCSQDSFPGLVSCAGSRSCSKYFSPVSPVFLPLQKPTLQIHFDVDVHTCRLNNELLRPFRIMLQFIFYISIFSSANDVEQPAWRNSFISSQIMQK